MTYLLVEDSSRSLAQLSAILFSDNGDGTITLYPYPKHWHATDEQAEKYTKELLEGAVVITLEDISAAEVDRLIGLAVKFEGFEENISANPTTSEVVHVPLLAKTETAVVPVKQATPAKPSYSRTEKAQSDKGILPSTGEVTSVLSALGAGLSAFGLAGLRRRK